MNAVVFAAYFPNRHRVQIYLDTLKKYYKDCDVYIGLNSSFPGANEYLESQGFPNVIQVTKALEVNSDASAYQAALLLLRSTNKNYDIIYFSHSKGTSYPEETRWKESCNDYFIQFMSRRSEVDNLISDTIGGVSFVGRKEAMNTSGYSKEMDVYCSILKQKEVEDIMSLITMYAIKGSIVKYFLDNCITSFFTNKLDRYFFETSFPLIVDKSGLQRHHLIIWK